jgi:hypothetical protein
MQALQAVYLGAAVRAFSQVPPHSQSSAGGQSPVEELIQELRRGALGRFHGHG